MIAFADSEEGMHLIQRIDAEEALSAIPTSKYRFRGLILSVAALAVGLAALAAGILVKDGRTVVPEDPIIPFELSAMQEAGIGELVSYVSQSEMDEPYKTDLIEELEWLLAELKKVHTEPDMTVVMAASLERISAITYSSSSAPEIITALWNSGGDRMEALVRALDTSAITEPDWGTFADGYSEFKLVMTVMGAAGGPSGDADEAAFIKWSLEDVSIKVRSALALSGIKAGDPLYDALLAMLDGDGGVAALIASAGSMSPEDLLAAASAAVDGFSEPLYAAVARLKINANTGEYVQRKLSVLFGVPILPFERPTLKESSASGSGDGDEDTQGGAGGGVGEGVEYGSNDLVLDPLTGKYVAYGELYARYYALMVEKLDNADYGYTEAQKKAIEKYFSLLYSGFKDK